MALALQEVEVGAVVEAEVLRVVTMARQTFPNPYRFTRHQPPVMNPSDSLMAFPSLGLLIYGRTHLD